MLKYFQQKIDVNDWLVFPTGKTQFPLHVQNHGRALLNDSTKMHALIEADVENYYPTAFAKATRVFQFTLHLQRFPNQFENT